MGLNQGPGFSPNVGALIGPGGGAVPSTRTITTTAPLTIDGGASADLSANRTIAVDTAGSLSIGRLLATTNGTAAAPSVLIEPSGNSGLFWDATNGVVLSVDAVDRIRAMVSGITDIRGGGSSTSTLRLTNSNGSIDNFIRTSTPEGAVTAGPGSLCLDITAGRLYLKRTGTGNTGWRQIEASESGAWSPTLTGVANVDAITLYQGFYIRVGGIVASLALVALDATTMGVNTQYRATLPVASNFATASDAGGGVFGGYTSAASITADTTNDALLCQSFTNINTVTTQIIFAMYTVL
jgi:hypothetical protein